MRILTGFPLQNPFPMLLTGLHAKMEINKRGRQRSPAVFDTQLDLYNSHLSGQHVQTEWHIWHTDGTAAKLWCNWCTTVAQCGPAASGDTFPRQRAASSGLAGGLRKEPSAIMLRPYVGRVLRSPRVFVRAARGSHVFVCRVFCCDTAIMDEC